MKPEWRLLLFLSVIAVLRFFYAGLTELTPDEAYYWEWSRNLQLSYYDHPPMVAYLIHLSTWIGGAHTETWIRFQGVLVGAGISLVAFFLGRDLFKSEKTGFTSAVAFNFIFLISVGCFIITPDTPQGFFTALTLYFFYKALAEEKSRWWVLSGISLGLSMLSKYTGVLLAPCILLTLLTRPEYRKWLIRKEFYLAAGIAFLLALPILIWNYQQNWVSITFQSKHGFSGLDVNPLVGFFDFIGTQFGLLTPFVFLAVLSTWVYSYRRRREDPKYHFIFWTSAPVFLFFCLMSFRQKIEGNWASFAYFVPLVGAIGISLDHKNLGARWGKWISFLKWSSITTSIGILGFVYIHAVIPLLSLPKNLDVTRRLHGWSTLGNNVDAILDELKPLSSHPFVFSHRHQIISELSFYMEGRPRTYKIGSGARYSYIKNVDHLIGENAVYVSEKSRHDIPLVEKHFARVDPPVTLTIQRAGRTIWEFVIVKCYDYKGGLIHT